MVVLIITLMATQLFIQLTITAAMQVPLHGLNYKKVLQLEVGSTNHFLFLSLPQHLLLGTKVIIVIPRVQLSRGSPEKP